MTDVILLWDSPLLFEKLFLEYGLECTRALSASIGTPYLPPCKVLIVPTGFGNENYTKIRAGIERNKKAFERFVEKGGILLVFSPLVPEYNYEWLPFKLKYELEENSCTPVPVGEHEAQKLVEGSHPPLGFDGYFSESEAKVVLEDEKGRAVMVVWEAGKGLVVASTVHELPAKEFFKCKVCGARKVKI
ncbi:MAG: hypothetical protein PHD41_06120 [Methanosarcinaceae archaeon]|nr:hypothetical protein [Methanosarcinaceae archaeon]MDD4331492.1 hypothetical protein [Methanosarcinaceae archaeon]MDD4749598.1 hypothetical protein [Methanosarcinaceae archaeon]